MLALTSPGAINVKISKFKDLTTATLVAHVHWEWTTTVPGSTTALVLEMLDFLFSFCCMCRWGQHSPCIAYGLVKTRQFGIRLSHGPGRLSSCIRCNPLDLWATICTTWCSSIETWLALTFSIGRRRIRGTCASWICRSMRNCGLSLALPIYLKQVSTHVWGCHLCRG